MKRIQQIVISREQPIRGRGAPQAKGYVCLGVFRAAAAILVT